MILSFPKAYSNKQFLRVIYFQHIHGLIITRITIKSHQSLLINTIQSIRKFIKLSFLI
uniref:Uncharacterized protein n=1 Tax=Rhizophora mucronata TaxID=61149 RepID=A0A2P2P0T2_RHIMU